MLVNLNYSVNSKLIEIRRFEILLELSMVKRPIYRELIFPFKNPEPKQSYEKASMFKKGQEEKRLKLVNNTTKERWERLEQGNIKLRVTPEMKDETK